VVTVNIQNAGDIVVLRCQGRIVRGEESALLCAAVRQHGQDIVLDLADVTAIDAAGIGALVSLQAAGIYLKLMNPTVAVRSVLRLTGIESVFEICEDEAIEEYSYSDGPANRSSRAEQAVR
jgi:anti-anti-sigma factor